MKSKTMVESARTGAAVVLGVAGIFGAAFAITSFVAQAAEEQTPAASAPGAPPAPIAETPASAPAPAPRAETAPQPPRPRRPAFAEIDADGDGAISPAEFEAFRPAGPPPRFEDGRPGRFSDGPPPRSDFDGEDRGAPHAGARRDRYALDEGFGPPPPPHDGYGQRPEDGRRGPPPHGRGERGGAGLDARGGGACECCGARREGPGGGEQPRPPRRPEY